MEPISIGTGLKVLYELVQILANVCSKVKENRAECVRLCAHAGNILQFVSEECSRKGVPARFEERLGKLNRSLKTLTETVDELSRKPLLQRAIWRQHISVKVHECYAHFQQTAQLFQMGTNFDIAHMLRENEEARLLDEKAAREHYDKMLQNDKDILNELQIHRRQMQEAMMCIHRHLARQAQLPPSAPASIAIESERRVLETGLHAMQRRSGPLKNTPDDFIITSLDVLIRYDDGKLGQGGFASVYEGNWKGVRVAVKVLDVDVSASILQREISVWKRLRHPHVLQFYGACPVAVPPFIVCAFMENGDAVEYLANNPDADRLTMLYEASLGLTYLHSNGVVHGDLKASNMLVDSAGRACLSDFGLSKIKLHTTTARRSSASQQSTSVVVEGTTRWMAPEHMTFGVMTKKTDVYSFAMTMYEVFSGQPPFATTPEALLLSVVCDRALRPPRPEKDEPGCEDMDDALWNVIATNWAPKPEDRQAAAEIEAALKLCLDSRRTLPPAKSSGGAGRRPIVEMEPAQTGPGNRLDVRPDSESSSTTVQSRSSAYWVPSTRTSATTPNGSSQLTPDVQIYVDSADVLQFMPASLVDHVKLDAKQKSWWKTSRKLKRDNKLTGYSRDAFLKLVFKSSLSDSLLTAANPIATMTPDAKCLVWGYIPVVVSRCGTYLKWNALGVPGIFQIPGSEPIVDGLQVEFEKGPGFGKSLSFDLAGCSVHDVAALLIRFLTLLPEPVIPHDMYQRFRTTESWKSTTPANFLASLKPLFSALPAPNRYLLIYLLDFLGAFADKAESNLLDVHNVARVFTPFILSGPERRVPAADPLPSDKDTVEILITSREWLMLEFIPTSVQA